MPTYRALQTGYVDERIVEAGELFTTDAPKGVWMEEVDDVDESAKPKRGRPASEPEKLTGQAPVVA